MQLLAQQKITMTKI